MNPRSILRFIPIVFLSGIIGCEQPLSQPTSTTSSAPASSVTGVGPEAQRMAMYLSGDLQPPADLGAQLQTEMAQIRSGFGADYPMVRQLIFRLPYQESTFLIKFSADSARSVARGTYHSWDALNSAYGLLAADSTLWGWDRVLLLQFGERLHPWRLADHYKVLPGVLWAEANAFIGDWPNVYPMLAPGGNTYLFRQASGDCPSGCNVNEYWYFVFQNGAPQFLGHYAPATDPQPPAWWGDAERNDSLYFALRQG